MLHGPAATKDTVEPDTVHTDGVEEEYDTESELDAVAAGVKDPLLSVCEFGWGKVIVCGQSELPLPSKRAIRLLETLFAVV